MKRAINFKMKNGKIVVIRPLKAADYGIAMTFLDNFVRGPGAIQTMQYLGQPKKDKQQTIAFYESPNNLILGVFYKNKMVGQSSIVKQNVGHPYSGNGAVIGTTILEQYTSNGIGNKLREIMVKWAKENNVHKITTHVRHDNIRSIGNNLKNGFIITGILHDAVCINGKYVHEYIFEKILEK
ncbi:MAG: GNAT family N-acetyltransferase [Alphaproteobacteria bacterium]|nr:GNAT family N-acetyltransferase [Alphaproteobacteria bacterium]